MKINNYAKLILYIILFIAFLLVRISHITDIQGIYETDLKGLAIASSTWPFGIIKNTAIYDFCSPIYYFILHFFINFDNGEIIARIINSIIALINIFLFVKIGKKLSNRPLGIFLGLFLCLNQFFFFYTNQIAPYCLIFLIGTLLIDSIIDFLKKPTDKTFKKLTILNCVFIICDSFGFIYVLSELLIFYFISQKKENIKKYVIKLAYHSFLAFLSMFIFYIIQYAKYTKMLIPANYNGIGFNLSALYLMINEYISPYLSFNSGEYQTKNTLGMLYSFFLNTDFKNINTIKIAITLFYSSILPLFGIFILSAKAFLKDYKLRVIFYISFINLLIVILAMLYEKIEAHPIFITQFFITGIILLGCGIFQIKDNFTKGVIIFCLFAIQIINPELNSYNITIKKQHPTINVFNLFKDEYKLTNNDFIIMPYLGNFAKMYYKKLNFFDYSDSMLQANGKDKIIKNLNNKKAKTMNKNNIPFLLNDYLEERGTNKFLTEYFIKNLIEKETFNNAGRIVLVVDKLNSRPVSQGKIYKQAKSSEYSSRLRKIDFKNISLEQNDSKNFFDVLKSKTLYNFIDLLIQNFYVAKIIEYKKIDNEYYKTENTTKDIMSAINSYNSDYVFIIFNKTL